MISSNSWDAAEASTAMSVTVYLLNDDGELSPDRSMLSVTEWERACRYRVEEKRRQFLFTRSAGREILSAHFGIPAREIEWNASGPPEIRVGGIPLPASFSCSHSGSLSALAIGSPQLRLGVDLEQIDQPLRPAALARVSLTDQERQKLAEWTASDQEDLLWRTWTIKEALLKSLRTVPAPSPQAVQLHWEIEDSDKSAFSFGAKQKETLQSGSRLSLAQIKWNCSALAGDWQFHPSKSPCAKWNLGWKEGLVKLTDTVKLEQMQWILALATCGSGQSQPVGEPLWSVSEVDWLEIRRSPSDVSRFLSKPSILTDVFIATIGQSTAIPA